MSPNAVASIFSFTKSPAKRKAESNLAKFHSRQALKKRKLDEGTRQEAARTLVNMAEQLPDSEVIEPHIDNGEVLADIDCGNFHETGVACQTEMCADDMISLEKECQSLRSENIVLKEMVKGTSFHTEESFRDNDDKVKAFTGLPSYISLMAVFKIAKINLRDTPSATAFQQVLLTLMRLHLNLTVQFLGYIFSVHSSTISRIFGNVVNILNDTLVPLCVKWPEREDVQISLPMCFRANFSKCVCIIDCFEIFIEKPKDFKARAQTYSQYKSHNTMKYLIGITPQGVISFISRGWGGRTTDPHITANSGFLDKLLPGDLILADRGFTIQDQVGLYCAKVEIPAFTRGKKQLRAVELEDTRKLAAVRIHVERVIGVARQKYTMLQGPVPITLLMTDNEAEFTPLDKIVRVACALTDLAPSVVPLDQC